MTPADQLRQAADLLEQRAADATPGPWHIEYDHRGAEAQALWVEVDDDCDHPDAHDGTLPIGGFHHPPNNIWVATVGPQFAPRLAEWLRSEARRFDELVGASSMLARSEFHGSNAVLFARDILNQSSSGVA